jgi:glycerophosphoryl diester phosphodiesterase
MKIHLPSFILILIFATISSIAQDIPPLPEGFDIQGHRGARGLKPENTLPSFEAALDLGVTTLELDMHFTADGIVVVWHDSAIGRESCYLPEDSPVVLPTPDSLIFGNNPRKISKLNLLEVQAFICDMNPNESQFPEQNNIATELAGDDYRIPTLRQVFELVETYSKSDLKTDEQRDNASIIRFNIESKRLPNDATAIGDEFDGENPAAFELAIIELVKEFELQDRVTIQSFDHRVVWVIKENYPNISVAALTNRGRAQLAYYAEQGADVWSPRYTSLTPELIQEAHDLGLKVIPWTINNVQDMTQLIELGVDGLITDQPDILLGSLDE